MNLLLNAIESSLQQKVFLGVFVFLTSYITVVLGVMQISLIRHSILPAAHFSTLVCPLCPLPSPPMAGGELPSLIIGWGGEVGGPTVNPSPSPTLRYCTQDSPGEGSFKSRGKPSPREYCARKGTVQGSSWRKTSQGRSLLQTSSFRQKYFNEAAL